MRDRSKLARDAMLRSLEARQQAGFDLYSPICVYDLCEKHGVLVRFHAIGSMEGFYERGAKPRIHLSSLRPLARRAFTCAHELGHHIYGHSSTIDELRDEGAAAMSDDQFLVDAFAGFVLMPTLGLRRAFATRSWELNNASPRQVHAVACEFGVGYATLIQHLAYGVHELNWSRAKDLLRHKPQSIRAAILGELSPRALIVADAKCAAKTIDAEVGMNILLPHNINVESGALVKQANHSEGSLWRAQKAGIAQVTAEENDLAISIRVAREDYVGLAAYRHFEGEDDD